MSYLGHASKHIVSSHHLNKKRKTSSPLNITIAFLIMVFIFFIARHLIGDILFGIRGLVLPDGNANIMLNSGAYDSELQSLSTENEELKKLLFNAGVKMSRIVSPEDLHRAILEETESELNATSTGFDASSSENMIDTDTDESLTPNSSRKIHLQKGDVISTVLIRPPQSPYDILTIDSGQEDGILIGEQVYAWTGFPIGEIVEVQSNRSIVKLFSAPGNKIEVYIGTSTMAVQAEGRGGGNFFLKLPKVSNIKNGDLVSRRFLPPEVFSEIESVDSNDGEAYTYAYFKLPINLNNLVYVLVKKNSAR